MTTTNGNVLREGLIIDQTGNMPITVWKEQIPIISEKQWFHITDVIIKNYFGSKLSTTRRSDKLNIPLDIINNFLKINVIEECQVDMDAVKEKILFVENADVIYNNKHVVTSIMYHDKENIQ